MKVLKHLDHLFNLRVINFHIHIVKYSKIFHDGFLDPSLTRIIVIIAYYRINFFEN